MSGWQLNKVVETHADLILAAEPSAKAYPTYFKTQMHGGKVRRLYTSYLWFARASTILTRLTSHPGGSAGTNKQWPRPFGMR